MCCCLYASISLLYSPGHAGWVGTAFSVPSTVRSLSTTGRCCCRHTFPSHRSSPARSSGLLPIASSSEDILALLTTGEQLQKKAEKVSLADRQGIDGAEGWSDQVSWFSPSQQKRTMWPFAHFPCSAAGWGEKEKAKLVG